MNNKLLKDHLKKIEKQAAQDKKRIVTFLRDITFEKLNTVLQVQKISKFKKLTVKTIDSKSTEDHLDQLVEKYVEVCFKDIRYSFILNKTELITYIDTKHYKTETLPPFELNFKDFTLKILLTILKTQ
jgi:hypothetical protein